MGADGREEDGRHVGVHHGAACSHRVGRAAGGGGQQNPVSLHLHPAPRCERSGLALVWWVLVSKLAVLWKPEASTVYVQDWLCCR